MFQAQHLGDELFVGAVDVGPGAERDGGDLHDPPGVPVADDPDEAEEVLVDGGLIARLQGPRGLETEVALPLQVVQLAEDLPVEFVLDREVLPALDGLGEAQVERPQTHVAEDPSDLVHGANQRGRRLLD